VILLPDGKRGKVNERTTRMIRLDRVRYRDDFQEAIIDIRGKIVLNLILRREVKNEISLDVE
jgi:hypothetical protein